MKTFLKTSLLLFSIITFLNCKNKTDKEVITKRQTIEMTTNYGIMVLELYNETPLHRDNFLKLIKANVYDSVLFHRVINNFMIQAGEPGTNINVPDTVLVDGGLNYLVPAEFNSNLFHKRGALGAARGGNPERASSSMQFYIVQNNILNDSLIDRGETRINNWLANHYSYKDPANSDLIAAFETSKKENDTLSIKILADSLSTIAKNYKNFEHYKIPENHREIYNKIGGTPHLDQNYTVFGELITGFNVLDSIANVVTEKGNRPTEEVRILSVSLVNND